MIPTIEDYQMILEAEVKRIYLLKESKKRADNKYYASKRAVEVLGALIKRERGDG